MSLQKNHLTTPLSHATKRRRLIPASASLAAIALAATRAGGAEPGKTRRLLILGDSLSAEYGIKRGAGWVALLDQHLQRTRPGVEVINASISGETTSGGLARLPALLNKHRPDLLLIELGANDGLRGLSLNATRDALVKMCRLGRAAGARILLAGMKIPPNYGRDYTQRFEQLFADVARSERAQLIPFLLAGVVERDDLFQPDRVHPTAQAQPIILNNVWQHLAAML